MGRGNYSTQGRTVKRQHLNRKYDRQKKVICLSSDKLMVEGGKLESRFPFRVPSWTPLVQHSFHYATSTIQFPFTTSFWFAFPLVKRRQCKCVQEGWVGEGIQSLLIHTLHCKSWGSMSKESEKFKRVLNQSVIKLFFLNTWH